MEKKVVVLDQRLPSSTCGLCYVVLGDGPKRPVLLREEEGAIFECTSFVPEYGSWFLRPDEFVAGGELVMLTEVDALFLALPLLDAAPRETFQPRDILMSSEELNLYPYCSDEQLSCLCETKQVGPDVVHRLDERRVAAWLQIKLDQVVADSGISPDEALQALSRYVAPTWIEKLRSTGDLQSDEAACDSAAILNYNHTPQPVAAAEPEKAPRPSKRRSKLDSVDKRDMRKVTDFFKPK